MPTLLAMVVLVCVCARDASAQIGAPQELPASAASSDVRANLPGRQTTIPPARESASPIPHAVTIRPAAPAPLTDPPLDLADGLLAGPEGWTSPEGLGSSLKTMLLLSVLSLAPAVLLMTTCFVRIVVVLNLLKQALGTQQLPPGQVMTSLSLFLTLLVMLPVWKDVYDNAVVPYTNHTIDIETAWTAGCKPVRRFMSMQIEKTGNGGDVRLFLDHLPESANRQYDYYEDVPLAALLPAFMISELKTAFLIGFQIYLPFLVLDMVISSVLVSMGMLMLPPVLVSLPFKLMLFVLVDGWHLIAGMLLSSFQAYT